MASGAPFRGPDALVFRFKLPLEPRHDAAVVAKPLERTTSVALGAKLRLSRIAVSEIVIVPATSDDVAIDLAVRAYASVRADSRPVFVAVVDSDGHSAPRSTVPAGGPERNHPRGAPASPDCSGSLAGDASPLAGPVP